jgi:hypothetical protein
VDCIELLEVDEDQALMSRNQSEYFFDLKIELNQRKKKKSKMNKSILENLDLAQSINQKLKNRNIDKTSSIKKLQLEMLDAQKTEKFINISDLEILKKQL